MTERKLPNPRDDLDNRLRHFRDEHDIASGRATTDKSRQNGVGFAMRIGTEVVAALIVGVGIGLLFDRWLDTKPWFMVAFFVLGAAAGMFNVYRVVQNKGGAVGYQPAPSSRAKSDQNGD